MNMNFILPKKHTYTHTHKEQCAWDNCVKNMQLNITIECPALHRTKLHNVFVV